MIGPALFLFLFGSGRLLVSVVPGLHQVSKISFGAINPAKSFRLLQAEASHAEVTLRRLHLMQHMEDCLCNIVVFRDFAQGERSL